jgi:hypothetical protein
MFFAGRALANGNDMRDSSRVTQEEKILCLLPLLHPMNTKNIPDIAVRVGHQLNHMQ